MNNKNTVYLIKERGHPYLYHWIVLMLGGLRHINENEYPIEICFEYLENQGYHLESLEIIKDKYKLVEKPLNKNILKENEGEIMIKDDEVDKNTFLFLRDLFLSRIENMEIKNIKRIYITRKNSGKVNPYNNGISKREILNEEKIYNFLKENQFEIISLEDYCFSDKVNIFRNADVIISPNSSALTFCIFCKKDCKVIEINSNDVPNSNHYQNICLSLNISYFKYSNIEVVGVPFHINASYNILLKEKDFIDFIKNKI